jgi:Tol biopolymer transport system component
VRVGSSFFKAVEWLARTSITAGYNDGQYGVAKPVTRGAMAAFIYRFDDWLAPLRRITTVETAAAASGSALYGHRPSISADGRWLVYHDQGWTPGQSTVDNVLVRDRESGDVELVSRTAGGDGGNASSWGTIGAGGDDIVITSLADDLALDPAFTDDNDDWDVVVAARTGGAIELASRTPGDVAADGDSFGGDLSDDGRWVVFSSEAGDLVADDAPNSPDVFLLDRDSGAVTLVSSTAAGDAVNGSSHLPVISGDGRWIAYCTNARELSPGLPIGAEALVVTDRTDGTTTMITSLSDREEETEDCESLDISADGRWIAFTSWRQGLVPGDTDSSRDVFVADRTTRAITLVSTATYGTPANGYATGASISADGRWIVYESLASNLVPRDTNGQMDVFVSDRVTGVTARVSAAADGTGGKGASFDAMISADGHWIVYLSWASNLTTEADTNGPGDVFVTSNPLLPLIPK